MIPLARALRPKTFDEVQGHESVINALRAVLYPLKHHTFLFSGSRGLGKTTFSRLVGQALLCDHKGSPCGHCESCIAIHQGRYPDFIEIDAASKTKVEDVRELVQSSYALPLQGKYKIYLFDEAHMLSQHSFNALLKALEEPPAHVIYILATTEPHKILPTIRSRCLSFHLQNPSYAELLHYAQTLCSRQNVAYELPILEALVWQAQGSYRDLLNHYQHALLIGQGSLTDPLLYTVFAVMNEEFWHTFFYAYSLKNISVLRKMIAEACCRQAPELFLQQLWHQLEKKSPFSEKSCAHLYIQLSEFTRLAPMHPHRQTLLELLILKSSLEFDGECLLEPAIPSETKNTAPHHATFENLQHPSITLKAFPEESPSSLLTPQLPTAEQWLDDVLHFAQENSLAKDFLMHSRLVPSPPHLMAIVYDEKLACLMTKNVEQRLRQLLEKINMNWAKLPILPGQVQDYPLELQEKKNHETRQECIKDFQNTAVGASLLQNTKHWEAD